MRVRDLMQTEVVTLAVNDALDIAEDITTLGRIRHLPVVDAGNRLVGILTQRDLLKASVSSVLGLSRSTSHAWLKKIPVYEVMTKVVTTIGPDADVREAVDLMVNGKFGCLPVVDKGILVGLLTETDCLKMLQGLLRPEPAAVLLA